MKKLFGCPNCKKKDNIGIKSMFSDKERKKIVFYARCSNCGYESNHYNNSNAVIDFLYNNSKEN